MEKDNKSSKIIPEMEESEIFTSEGEDFRRSRGK
jgi:hypothetical protein